MDEKKKLKTGKDSVVIGDVSGEIGDGSVVIGATDANGNVILNQSMAVGRNAKAGPGSIAIGAGAGAGSGADISLILEQINGIVKNTDDPQLISSFTAFCEAAKSPEQNKTILSTLWNGIKSAASLSGAIDMIGKVSVWIAAL
jgi:hypothetical protein